MAITMREFIENKVSKRIKGYQNENELIVSEYARENELGKSYKGREILELIQNAEDELIDELPKEILISFDGKTLSISNYGEPFSEEGITSLMYSNNSNKKKRKKKVIGNKGTGFRSILGWAEEIKIDSADLHIKFSHSHAQDILKNVVFENKKVPKNIKAATLVFPEWNESNDTSAFTTTISITIKSNEDVANDIREQLSNLNGNLLLFLNRTERLIVDLEGVKTSFEKTWLNDEKVLLVKKESESIVYSKEWLLNKKEGVIGEEYYTVIIAYDLTGEVPDNPYIYTYFQTDVRFPFPVLLHADFNLNNDRNHLLKNDSSNKIILEEAATLLVDTAIRVYEKGISYNRIKFLIPKGDIEVELEKYKFMDILHNKMKVAELFPTVNAKYVTHDENLVFYTSGLAKYLSGKDFSDLLMYSDDTDVDDLLSDFGYSQYEYSVIAERVNRWVQSRTVTDDNIRKVAYTAIQFLDEFENDWHFRSHAEQCPSFFYNTDRNIIQSGKSIFLIDENYDVTKPPIFADIEFLDPYMRQYLYKCLKENNDTDVDVLVDKLGSYNLREYNTAELMEHINKVLKSKLNDKKYKDANSRWKTLIKWLWGNRKLLLAEKANINMLFLNRKDELVNSSELYYGIEYGNALAEDLLGNTFPECMICNLKEYLEYENDEMIQFLSLFGVSDLPKMKVTSFQKYTGYNRDECDDYVRKVFSYLSFPLNLNSDVFNTLDDFCRRVSRVEIRRTEISNLKRILEKASTSSIIKWILSDTRLQNHLYSGFENSVMSVEVVWDDLRSFRLIPTMKKPYSYIYHLFLTIPWIQVKDKRHSITDCLLGFDARGVDLSDYIVEPEIAEYIKDVEGPKGKIKKEYQAVFEKLQVKRDFADLSVKKIYDVLNYLPTVEGSEDIARSFYNSLVDKTDNEYSPADLACEEYVSFIKNGKILTNNGFQPVQKSYYLDGKDICEKIAKTYNLILVPKKRSKARIKRMLGVDQLVLIGEIVEKPQIHPENTMFNNDFNQFKIAAFTYRINKVSDLKKEARQFMNMKIMLCTKVKASYRTDKEKSGQLIELDDYEYIFDGDSTYYLKVPEALSYSGMKHNMDLSVAIASIFSSYLDVDEIFNDYRALYYVGSNIEREEWVKQEFDDDSILRKAKECLNINEDVREEFLDIIVKLSGKDTTTFNPYLSDIDFEDINADYNVPTMINVFSLAGIDLSDYNAENPAIPIDFSRYFKRKIQDTLPLYESKYKVSWFRRLEKTSMKERISLVSNFLLFDSSEIRIDNSIYFNVDNEIINQLEIDVDTEHIDLIKLYTANLSEWKTSQVNTEYVDEFVRIPENMSLLYYSEFDELSVRYKDYCHAFIVEDESDITELQTNDEKTVEVFHAHAKPGDIPRKRIKNRTTTGFSNKGSKKSLESIGLAGEEIVYEQLLKDENKQLVRWVSENAKKKNINPEGGAGFGYDMEYIDLAGNRKYVEVKAAKNGKESGIKFYLSDYEYEFGRQHADDYLIYYVCNATTNHPQILIFDDVFKKYDFNKKSYSVDISSEYTVYAQAELI